MNYPLFNVKESALIPHKFKPLLLLMFPYLITYQEVQFLLRKSGTLRLHLVLVAHFTEIQAELLGQNGAFDL